jgi:hypothetical protein
VKPFSFYFLRHHFTGSTPKTGQSRKRTVPIHLRLNFYSLLI